MKYIFAEDMVVLTVATTQNPYTVYFDEPIPKAECVRLLSCSLPNSWYNLKKTVRIFLEGHYTLEAMAKEIQNIFKKDYELPTQINTPSGAMVIYNLENRRIRLDKDFWE